MKWENQERSQAIEVDCLGKRTPLDGSPESEAALKCQAEIDNIRQGMVRFLTETMPSDGLNPAAQLASVKAQVAEAMRNDVSIYLDIKEQQSKTKGPVEKFRDDLNGKDTYEARVEEFKQLLEIPPIVLEGKKGAMQKEHPRAGNPKD